MRVIRHIHMFRCVVVCCSVLQCVAVCCSALCVSRHIHVHSCACRDVFMCVPCIAFMCVPWILHVHAMTHVCAWHDDSFTCVPRSIFFFYVCELHHSFSFHDACRCVQWLIHVRAMTHSYVCHELFSVRPMTHIRVCHDSFMSMLWPIKVRVMTLMQVCAMTS